jgi:hypothetical protein
LLLLLLLPTNKSAGWSAAEGTICNGFIQVFCKNVYHAKNKPNSIEQKLSQNFDPSNPGFVQAESLRV